MFEIQSLLNNITKKSRAFIKLFVNWSFENIINSDQSQFKSSGSFIQFQASWKLILYIKNLIMSWNTVVYNQTEFDKILKKKFQWINKIAAEMLSVINLALLYLWWVLSLRSFPVLNWYTNRKTNNCWCLTKVIGSYSVFLIIQVLFRPDPSRTVST